jgi:hypothetical protein
MSTSLGENTLEYQIYDQFSERDSLQVEQFFQVIGMPVPQVEEYYITNEGGALVFLTPYGCAIRIAKKGYPMPPHPRVLQPLASRYTDNLRIDINPGATTGYTDKMVESGLNAIFIDHGFFLDDASENNVVHLPKTDYVLALDTEKLSVKNKAKAQKFWDGKALAKSPQTQLYAPLRTAFNAAWKPGSLIVDSEKMKQFWEAAQSAKKQGILVSAWENKNYWGTTKAAENYMKVLTNSKLPLLTCAA